MKSSQSVFKDESKLDINFVPNRLPHREKEHRLLMEFFSFLLKYPDRMAQRVLVTGEIGTGKTALCQRFGADITLEAHKSSINLHYVHVNCREYRGKLFLILQHALTVLKPTFPKRGYGAEEVLKSLLQNLDEENAYMILALDEFDTLHRSGRIGCCLQFNAASGNETEQAATHLAYRHHAGLGIHQAVG